MEGLFEAILRNPFLVLLIIGGLISFFKGKNPKQEENKHPPINQPKRVESRPGNSRKEVVIKRQPPKAPVRERVETLTIEEHQQKQMEGLMSRLNTLDSPQMYGKSSDANMQRNIEVQNLVSHYSHSKFKKNFVTSLNKEGLINSIIMAEVLGLPRAKQPYQSIAIRRNQK